MRSILPLTICAFVLGSGLLSAQGAPEGSRASGTIVETARSAGNFETLAAALDAAGLVTTLQGEGPFTVFAPTDAAFAKLPEGTLESLLLPENRGRLVQILTAHVVAGENTAAAALAARRIETVEGSIVLVRLDGGRLKVNEASVVANDIRASNGIIHVIDAVLIPSEKSPEAVDPRLATLRVLSLAIDRGVPLYNAGQTAACAAIYEVAVRSVIDRPAGCPEAVLRRLRESTVEASRSHDAVDVAWALRRGIDRAVELLLLDLELNRELDREAPSMSTDTVRIFDFDDTDEVASWFALNDDVMGGVSSAQLVAAGSGVARFEGALSLENNGGFATVRSRARDLGLEGTTGLRFRVRGDGRTYRVSGLTSDRRSEVRIWQSEFTTIDGEWQEISVPFDALVLNIMGRRLAGAGPLPPERIRSISFGVADKNETPFRLEIDWIESYRSEPSLVRRTR